tara:strand:- start:1348 stop:2337 length:990 start_codon:yes stop_codon:yes gene_type:complete
MDYLLEVKNLTINFFTKEGTVHAVEKVSFKLKKGEILGIVGESGSGKSVSMLGILGLIKGPQGKVIDGEIIFDGKNLMKISEENLRQIRGNQIAMIFQDPMSSLNPVLKIKDQIGEVLKTHLGMDKVTAKKRTIELLAKVGIPSPSQRIDDYPHQFSGGMRQRVMIAMALACEPQILIADEPTTALDVTIQSQIVDLIKDLQNELKMSVIWITHDLSLLARIAKRINVMYAGSIIETADIKEIYSEPKHPYTIGLIRSIPRLDEVRSRELFSIEGLPPDLLEESQHCLFAPRCKNSINQCLEEKPNLFKTNTSGHFSSCFRWKETASFK